MSLYQSLAIVAALAEARLLAPTAVSKWADFFAANLPPNTSPDVREGIRAGIEGFAATLRCMAKLRPGAGKGVSSAPTRHASSPPR